jgi:2-iminobutanoate/2-iminopropanoate deaminase
MRWAPCAPPCAWPPPPPDRRRPGPPWYDGGAAQAVSGNRRGRRSVAGVEQVATGEAPAAIGPYSQAVRVGPWLWVSGQLGLDPKTGELVTGGAAAEASQAMKNVLAIVAAAGLGPEHIVRTGIFVSDIGTFAQVNEAYAAALGSARPARATVEVAALPRGGHVEIEAIACKGV